MYLFSSVSLIAFGFIDQKCHSRTEDQEQLILYLAEPVGDEQKYKLMKIYRLDLYYTLKRKTHSGEVKLLKTGHWK